MISRFPTVEGNNKVVGTIVALGMGALILNVCIKCGGASDNKIEKQIKPQKVIVSRQYSDVQSKTDSLNSLAVKFEEKRNLCLNDLIVLSRRLKEFSIKRANFDDMYDAQVTGQTVENIDSVMGEVNRSHDRARIAFQRLQKDVVSMLGTDSRLSKKVAALGLVIENPFDKSADLPIEQALDIMRGFYGLGAQQSQQ